MFLFVFNHVTIVLVGITKAFVIHVVMVVIMVMVVVMMMMMMFAAFMVVMVMNLLAG